MFSEIKLGDKVWCVANGWGIILGTKEPNQLPLMVDFGKYQLFYTIDGKRNENDKQQSLFWNEFNIPKDAYLKQLINLEVDTKLIVCDQKSFAKAKNRYFSHFNEYGKACCFIDGKSKWSGGTKDKTLPWEYWEVVEEK